MKLHVANNDGLGRRWSTVTDDGTRNRQALQIDGDWSKGICVRLMGYGL